MLIIFSKKSIKHSDDVYNYQDPVFLGFYLDFDLNSPLLSLREDDDSECAAYFFKIYNER